MRYVALLLPLCVASAFVPPFFTAASQRSSSPSLQGSQHVLPETVAVAGATGRTGRLVVNKLLDSGVKKVVALVRDAKRAAEVLPNDENVQVVPCDLGKPEQITKALDQVDAAVWCATGFSDAEASALVKVKRLLGIALVPKKSVDAVALPTIATALGMQTSGDGRPPCPKIVMCSSAGVTRLSWDEDKKEMLKGAADIPIVRLNPFGILGIKQDSETALREKCTENNLPYCIVRPTGLNDEWPSGSRPIFSQGDVAVGRINREDVATILVDALSTPEATGKTFEVFALNGYPPAVEIGTSLARLRSDDDGPLSPEEVRTMYHTMQQLLPGEQQDAAALAMGQTYEQLDKGETGRLGKRGKEALEEVTLKPSS